jgi:glycolate oxidase FAD binding subunit
MTPKVVISPGTIVEVSKVVAYANKHDLGVIPRGHGTKIGTGNIPQKTDIVLLTDRLNRITDKDCDNLTLSVESGMTLSGVQKCLAMEGKGYFLPLDPPFSERATLGGIAATNSSGPKRLLYGTARDLITGIRAVYPNGDIVVSGGKTVKNVSGYDMCKLLIGSFGTLAIICEITFKLLPLPEKEATLLVPFTGLERANAFAREIRHSQLLPAAVGILNSVAVAKVSDSLPVPANGNYLVAIGLEGVAESVERQVLEMGAMGRKHEALAAVALDQGKQAPFWNVVRDFSKGLSADYPNLVSLKSNFLTSRCEEILRSYEKKVSESGFEGAFICLSGSGILNAYVMGKDMGSKTDSLVKLIGKLADEAVKNEGNLVVESSPLAVKKEVDVWGTPRSDCEIMRRIKVEIDPANTLNPGRFVGGI